MSAVIPPEFQPFVFDGIASGRFRSEEDAVKEGLILLRSREEKLDALRRDIQIGLDDLEAGRTSPFDADDIIKRGRQRLDTSRAAE